MLFVSDILWTLSLTEFIKRSGQQVQVTWGTWLRSPKAEVQILPSCFLWHTSPSPVDSSEVSLKMYFLGQFSINFYSHIFQSENFLGTTWASEQLLHSCQPFFNIKTQALLHSVTYCVSATSVAVQGSVQEQTVYLMANSKTVFKVQMKFQHSKWEV